jgi:RNA polymerase sigma-70 factor (ECF subfamily)
VWSSARNLGVRGDGIDDVVQDVFIVIHTKLDTLQRPESLRSWIYSIVRRTASEHRRSRQARMAAWEKLGAEVDSNSTTPPSPLDLAERRSDLALLESLLSGLGELKREIFVMVEILEMSVPEVVQALEIPMNTAYSRLRTARESFEKALARHEARTQSYWGFSRPWLKKVAPLSPPDVLAHNPMGQAGIVFSTA